MGSSAVLAPREDEGAVIPFDSFSSAEMALRLADLKGRLDVVQQFFAEVMVKGQDYGVIPGTDKPSLLKPGAEKLAELYGYAPEVKSIQETAERDSGYYRAVVTISLVSRRNGAVVAEGVGEANTYEGRYRWRWVPDWKLPKGVDTKAFHSEVRTDRRGKEYTSYRVENEDPHALWNTVLKMAKKRALVDGVLSATRSSGLFTQDAEDLAEWVGGPRGGGADQADPETGAIIPRWTNKELNELLTEFDLKVPDLEPELGASGITKDTIRLAVDGWFRSDAGEGRTLRDLVQLAADRKRAAAAAPAEAPASREAETPSNEAAATPIDNPLLKSPDGGPPAWWEELQAGMAERDIREADVQAVISSPFNQSNVYTWLTVTRGSVETLLSLADSAKARRS